MHSQNEVIRREIECKFIYNQECFMAYIKMPETKASMLHTIAPRAREREREKERERERERDRESVCVSVCVCVCACSFSVIQIHYSPDDYLLMAYDASPNFL